MNPPAAAECPLQCANLLACIGIDGGFIGLLAACVSRWTPCRQYDCASKPLVGLWCLCLPSVYMVLLDSRLAQRAVVKDCVCPSWVRQSKASVDMQWHAEHPQVCSVCE